MSLDAIKARLGSISPTRMAELSPATRVLLTEDMPKLIEFVEVAQVFRRLRESDCPHPQYRGAERAFEDALDRLEEP